MVRKNPVRCLPQALGGQPRYIAGVNDCIGFCTAGLGAAGLPFQSGLLQIPNLTQMAFLADATFQGSTEQPPKEEVTSKICFTDENGNQVCQ